MNQGNLLLVRATYISDYITCMTTGRFSLVFNTELDLEIVFGVLVMHVMLSPVYKTQTPGKY